MERHYMTCRFCKQSGHRDEDFVKYGTRHYAHYSCYLNAGKSLSALQDWKILRFPFRLLKQKAEWEAIAMAAYRRQEDR